MIKKIIHYSFILGLILFLTFLFRIDYRETFRIIKSVQFHYVLIGLLFSASELVFKSLKLQRVIQILIPISFRNSLIVYLIGLPYGAITPGKLGDVVKLYTLRQKTKLSRTDCIALGLVERLLEMIALVGLAGVGVIILVGQLPHKQFLSLLILMIILFVLLFVILNQKIVHAVLRPIFYIIVPEKMQHKPRVLFYEFYGSIEKLTKDKWAMSLSLFLCLLGWLSVNIRTYYFAKALGLNELNITVCLFLAPLVTVIELIPVSILGVGTRDYALVSLLSMLGVASGQVVEKAFSLSLMMLVLGGIPPAFLGYGVAIKEHVKWKEIDTLQNNENNQSISS